VHRRGVAQREIGPADRPGEEEITGKTEAVSDKGDVPRRVPRQMPDVEQVFTELHAIAFGELMIGRRRVLDHDAPPRGVTGRIRIEERIGGMEPDRHRTRGDDAGHAAYVIKVRVGEPDGFERTAGGIHGRQQRVRLIPGIDENGLPTYRIGQQPTVLLQRANGELPQRERAHGDVESGVSGTGASVVASTGDSPMP